MMALAVLDLPFQPAAHTASLQGVSRTLQAGSPLLLVSREIGESAPVSDPPPLLVRQNYFRVDDRYRFEGNERVDAFVTGPFQSRTAYGCQVVLVNPSPARRVLRLLAQIPQGAVPLQGGAATRSVPVTLEPYATRMIETLFYFPEPGRFPHYPAQVAQGGRVAASADPGTLEVVETLPAGDADSWPRVSQEAASEVVLDYLARHNLHRLDLDALAWRLKDRAFYDALLALLRRRHLYQESLWSYGLYHRDPQAIREYLSHADFADRCGLWLDSPLLRLDPVARNRYQHLEYAPLIHARAHALGKRRQILNDRLYEQYQRFLAYLSYRPTLDDRDRLAVVYYLLLQDRVEEALAFFTAIDPAALEEKIQYDYLALVLDFYGGATARARTRAEPYRDYPVPRWRALFAEALRQLDEGEGRAPAAAAGDDRASAQAEAAAAAPGLELRVDARRITVDYQNLTSCRIHYYPMDIELLFSRNPFVQQQSGQFAFVQPQETQELALPAGQTRVTIDLPRRYFSRNVMIDVTGGGLRRTAAYCANALAVQVIEPYGQLRVTHDATGKPLAGVYVKAYARGPDGTVRFYKDGYTDLRGRFDYATLQAGEPGGVERFALLILSEADGAVIREAAPPNR